MDPCAPAEYVTSLERTCSMLKVCPPSFNSIPVAVARKTAPSPEIAGGAGGVGRCSIKPAATSAITLAQAVSVRAPDKIPNRGEGPRGSLAAPAFAGRQAQPDIGFHLGGQPVPGDGRQFIQRDQGVARRCEHLYLVAALAATSQVTLRTPAGEPTEVLAGVKSQNGLIRMRHGFLFSIYRRSLVRALAMCDRTVALEQSSRRATSSAGKPSTSRSISSARSRAVNRRKPSSR